MTGTRQQTHSIEIETSPQALFALLHKPSAIRGWWGVSRAIVVPEPGGIWVAAWGEDEDAADYVTLGTITAFEPPRLFALSYDRYFAKTGPLPYRADFEVEFEIEPLTAGRVRLTVTQSGFPRGPEADPFYAAVETGWVATLRSLKAFAER